MKHIQERYAQINDGRYILTLPKKACHIVGRSCLNLSSPGLVWQSQKVPPDNAPHWWSPCAVYGPS